jgi:hypothetical protein
MRWCIDVVVVSMLVLAGAGRAHAAEPKVPVTKVELRENPALAKKGKVAIYKGEADKDGVAFYVEGLGIGVPVVAFLASEAGAPMTLQLKNDMSEKWERKVERDPKTGIAEARFRTEGPAMLLVTSSGPRAKYQLVVWVGPEIKMHKLIKPPFVSKAKFDKKKSGGSGTAGIIIGIAITCVFVIGLVVLVRRMGKKGATR